MNKKCVALSQGQYEECIRLLRSGFELDGKSVKPNERIAAVGVLQACLGLRLGDTLKLKLSSFVRDGNRWRLDIQEEKTGKARAFTVPVEVYSFVQEFAYENGIGKDMRLFPVSERQVERHLNKAFAKMGLPRKQFGSHSFRKFFSMKVYTENDCNIELVRVLLQHSSVQVTQRYLSISQKLVENALAKTAGHIV